MIALVKMIKVLNYSEYLRTKENYSAFVKLIIFQHHIFSDYITGFPDTC